MRVAINRRSQKPLNRLLRRSAGYELPAKQPADGAQELQIDQGRSIDIGLQPEAGSNWTVRTLVQEGADPGAGIGDEHLCSIGSDQLFELASRQTATGDRARTRHRLLHRRPGGLADQHLPRVRRQGQVTLCGAFTESLQGLVRHVPYLQRRRHGMIVACRMHAPSSGVPPRADWRHHGPLRFHVVVDVTRLSMGDLATAGSLSDSSAGARANRQAVDGEATPTAPDRDPGGGDACWRAKRSEADRGAPGFRVQDPAESKRQRRRYGE